MRTRNTRVEEPQSPNLIPMIDVMFLLLLFFMLGADLAARERVELNLAEADRAKEEPLERQVETVVNVQHVHAGCATIGAGRCPLRTHWRTSVAGVELSGPELGRTLAELALAAPEHVSLRVDRGAPYGLVQRAIEACGAAGLYRLSLAVELPRGG
jgi:biopolymer transport protein ExbD